MQAGWRPAGPVCWYDAEGSQWRYSPDATAADFDELMDQLTQDVQIKLWQQAAKHHLGQQLDQGADVYSLGLLLKKWQRQGLMHRAGTLQAIAAGGMWTAKRCSDSSCQTTGSLCPRCHMEEETDFHRCWSCPKNVAPDDEWIQQALDSSNHLVETARQAVANKEQHAYWLRGMIPKSWTERAVEAEQVPLKVKFLGEASEQTRSEVVEAFIDGSGSHSDPRLRLCGWAAVWLQSEGQQKRVGGAVIGNMPMSSQKVPAAELTALLWILKVTHGDITIWTDCEYVSK
eukprot:5207686-Karenia_brevis.AAC.1